MTSNETKPMRQILGNFIDKMSDTEEYLTISFSPNTKARQQRWSNYGLSADFLGDYFSNFFPGDVTTNSYINKQEVVKASVSYIANELLENAMKFCNDTAKIPVKVSLYLYDTKIIFLVSNGTNLQIAERYQAFIQEILKSDIDELYIRHLERAASGVDGSRMGILTMLHDYSAKFGWKFEPLPKKPEVVKVTVMVHLSV